MGVRGLQTFLKNNQHYLGTTIFISNTTLVIDANNLLCLLFTEMTTDQKSPHWRFDLYGGDLVAYGEIIREFFKNLEKCNIVPILVFDGSVIGKESLKDYVVSKEKCIFQRGLKKFEAAKTVTEQPNPAEDHIFMPNNLNIVFKNIIVELGLQKIQTPYEADAHIARLANDLNCPVLTNDSDFWVFGLTHGFILIDLFTHKRIVADKAGKYSIECCIFDRKALSKNLPGLSPKNLPLLSVLLGNDYVEAGTFDRVIETICNRPYDGYLMAKTFNHRRIANLLTWLRRRTLDDAIRFIIEMLPNYQGQQLEKRIRMLLLNYVIEKTDDFDKEVAQVYSVDVNNGQNEASSSGQNEKRLPEKPAKYLRKLFETTSLSSTALDMIFHNTHYNYSVVDDLSLPSSSYSKFRPYSLALVLLRPRSYENLTSYRKKIQSEKDAFLVYDRIKDEYTKLIVRPMESLENFGSLEHLDCFSMIDLEPALKKTLLTSTFRFNCDESSLMSETFGQIFKGPYVPEACLCMLLIKYIGLETKLKPKPEFVNAVTLTLFYYAALAGQLSIDTNEAYGNLLLRLRPHSVKNNNIPFVPNQSLFKRIVHFLSQLQTVYKAYNIVNNLLQQPYHVAREDRFLNCVLIYRLTRLFRLGEASVESLCDQLPELMDICCSIRTQVHCES